MKTSPDQLIYILIDTAIMELGTQKALAQKLGRSESTVGNWRVGKTAMPASEFLRLFAWYRSDSLVETMMNEVLDAAGT